MLKINPPDYKYCPFCGSKMWKITIEKGMFKRCEKCNWVYYPHVAAAACGVAIREGKVLLVKRAREPYKDTWMTPAGFVSFGEHPEETVIREIKEETGYKAKVVKLLTIIQTDDDPRSMGHFSFYFEVTLSGKVKILDKEENCDIGWFPLDKLPTIGWHGHQKVLRSLGGLVY